MISVTILIGIPGSGKSTWARHVVEQTAGSVHYISSDEIRKNRFDDVADMANNDEVFWIMKDALQIILEKGESAVLDATFVKSAERAPYIQLAKNYEAKITAYYINVSLDEALKRNAQRERKVPVAAILQRHVELEVPTVAEGFDEIIVVNE